MKINRFALKLVKTDWIFGNKKEVFDRYFAPCGMINDRATRYDQERRCYFFSTMDDALKAREELKAYFTKQLREEKMAGFVPLYDVYSDMIPWYDADFDRKTMQLLVDNGRDMDTVIIASGMEGIETLIEELEKEDLPGINGDEDVDIPTGEIAIRMAELGFGKLQQIIDGIRTELTIEEAKKIVKYQPETIYLIFDLPF